MSAAMEGAAADAGPVLPDACWSSIGVSGDRSCAKLEQHVHCRNCPVFAQAAARFLNRDIPAEQLAEWTRQVARPLPVREHNTHSVVVFRIGPEWLGLPTDQFREIASLRPVHGLPHQRSEVVRGVVNIRGALVVCVALSTLLALDQAAQPRTDLGQLVHARLLVLQRDGARLAVPVDEVQGVHRYHPREVRPVPSTIGGATAAYTRGVLPYLDHRVGLLDADALFQALRRSLS